MDKTNIFFEKQYQNISLTMPHYRQWYLIVFTSSFNYQEANKRNNNWLPPPWAIVAMVVLGFNEFMTLLRYLFACNCGIDLLVYKLPRFPFVCRWVLIILAFLHGRNPLYLGVIFVAFLLSKALWVQLDIAGEFRHGIVSSKLSKSFKPSTCGFV